MNCVCKRALRWKEKPPKDIIAAERGLNGPCGDVLYGLKALWPQPKDSYGLRCGQKSDCNSYGIFLALILWEINHGLFEVGSKDDFFTGTYDVTGINSADGLTVIFFLYHLLARLLELRNQDGTLWQR